MATPDVPDGESIQNDLACAADIFLFSDKWHNVCELGRWHDFRHPGKYIALGRREAEEHLAEIQALVNRKEPTHELEPAESPVATIT